MQTYLYRQLCVDSLTETGVSQENLQENMEAALQVYLDRDNNISFGSMIIKMYRGATDQRALHMNEERKDLLVFLRRTKEQNRRGIDTLKIFGVNVSDTWCKTCQVNTFFSLKACYKAACCHPICQKGKPANELVWCSGGPHVEYLPFPVPDPKRCWGSNNSEKCGGFCKGHFMTLEQVLAMEGNISVVCNPHPLVQS